MIVEWIPSAVCFAASTLAAKGFIDVLCRGVRFRQQGRGADIETIVVKIAAPPAPNPLAAIEAHEAHLAAGSPFAFWLDYARKAVVPAKPKPVDRPWPNCPSCGTSEYHQVLTEHAGVATSWSCTLCGTDFTRRGKIGGFAARKARKTRETRVAYEREAVEARKLPCGCSGEVRTRSYPTGGFDMGRYAECTTCGGTWDYAPKYDDTGNPRKMHPRSGPVEWPNADKKPKKHAYCGCGMGPPHVVQEHETAMAVRDRYIETQAHTAAILNVLNEIDYENDLPPPPHHD